MSTVCLYIFVCLLFLLFFAFVADFNPFVNVFLADFDHFVYVFVADLNSFAYVFVALSLHSTENKTKLKPTRALDLETNKKNHSLQNRNITYDCVFFGEDHAFISSVHLCVPVSVLKTLSKSMH